MIGFCVKLIKVIDLITSLRLATKGKSGLLSHFGTSAIAGIMNEANKNNHGSIKSSVKKQHTNKKKIYIMQLFTKR